MQWIVKQTKSKGYEFTFDIMKDGAVIGQAHYIPKMLRQGYGIRLNDSKFLLQYMPAADARAYMRGINTKDILSCLTMTRTSSRGCNANAWHSQTISCCGTVRIADN